ncbi:MAG: glycoside hydrolase family 16 protein [Pseudobdellovibrionaceae bacterium]|nr:glycoside hydrolase family 16 protein [Pseudobdellovibrionaceae bacterium]
MPFINILIPLLLLGSISCTERPIKNPTRSADSEKASTTLTGREDFNRDLNDGLFKMWGGGHAISNKNHAEASDGRVAHLILPQGSAAGPTHGPNLEARSGTFLYGSFAARLKTPQCRTHKEGNIAGFFTYFNDGTDADTDGLADNSEIDFEWLCAEPESIYLTLWTDYDDASGGQQRVIRKINLARGVIEYTRLAWGWGQENTKSLDGVEAQPTSVTAIPGYDASQGFYEYGFDWSEDAVTWWMRDPKSQEKIILWDYRGPKERLTQRSAHLLVNTWHSSTWAPEDTPDALEAPQTDLVMEVDWVHACPDYRSRCF